MDGLPSRTSHPLLQRTAKPSSVLTRACAYASNGHFSRLMVTHQLKHATRFQTHEPRALAASFDDSSGNCLRLHEVGFALPRVSPLERCALTAPFHPYRAKYRSAQRGGLFSVALSLTHHLVLPCSDFPLGRFPAERPFRCGDDATAREGKNNSISTKDLRKLHFLLLCPTPNSRSW